MNQLFVQLGIASWKPFITVALLPPVPWLLIALFGALVLNTRRRVGRSLVAAAVAGVWLCSCNGFGLWLERTALNVPPPLGLHRIEALKSETRKGGVAVVVLGGGVESIAPEYAVANLAATSLERLRYGLWLARAIGAPVAFSGGVGWATRQSAPEGEVAARIAREEFRQPLRWAETDSRDTHENAANTVPLLADAGVRHIVLVTHGVHMPRALRDFDRAATGRDMRIEAAPMGLAPRIESPLFDWVPTNVGIARVRNAVREGIGWWMGA